jgi:hypothetical protein
MNALALSLSVPVALVALDAAPTMDCVRPRRIMRFGPKSHLSAYSVISAAVMVFLPKTTVAGDQVALWPIASAQILPTLGSHPSSAVSF